jgi:hypothetical protein
MIDNEKKVEVIRFKLSQWPWVRVVLYYKRLSIVKNFCLLISCLILNSLLSFGQLDVSVGVTMYNSKNSNIGLNAGVSLKNFYLDISSNLKGGEGERQDNSSNSKTEDIFVFLMNTGYNFPIKRNWYILPIIGVGWKSDIYQNYYGARNTYSYENSKLFMNIGLSTKFFIKGDVGLILGIGYPELANIAVVYKLWD